MPLPAAAPRLPDLDDDDDPSAAPPGPDPAAARIGPFTAGTVLQSLVYGTGGDEQDAADADAAVAVAAAGSAVPALQVPYSVLRVVEGCLFGSGGSTNLPMRAVA